MTAVLKIMEPKREKKVAFQIPSIEEIRIYISDKQEWPPKFIDYYAEKFWSFYQSNGWKVSGKAAMKDWKAAFTSQWQRPKFKEDIDYLNECLKSYQKLKPVEKQNSNYLNDLLAKYKAQFDSVTHETLVACYDFLKAEKKLKLTQAERELMIKVYANEPEKGKAACVTTLFMRMINHGQTF